MKKFLTTVAVCLGLLILLANLLFPPANAAENPLLKLLELPAPPPPNPAVKLERADRPEEFFDESKPPADDSPIADILAYWSYQSDNYRELGYNPKPSEKVIDRLLAKVEEKPELVPQLLNVFRDSKRAVDVVKKIYDRMPVSPDDSDRRVRATLKRWLTYNSSYFSSQLATEAAKATDVDEYVSNQQELLALGRVDWDRARPLVDRLYGGSGKVSRVLAQWALYRNALDNNSLSDIERYRRELMDVVEDKTAMDGMRDLAFDALVKEKEWVGRDEWYYSLLSDETLAELRVGGSTYTGLTTIMYYSPKESYVDKMIELMKSDNKTVRTAAAKNLFRRLDNKNPEIVRALLPWLSDPKWINVDGAGRAQVIHALEKVKLPESVPALIAALDEKSKTVPARSYPNMNTNAAVSRMMGAAANVANVSSAYTIDGVPINFPFEPYPLRQAAITALAYQEDARAIPALRRLLTQPPEPYVVSSLVIALYKCGGFSLAEQVDALEGAARDLATEDPPANPMANVIATNGPRAANMVFSDEGLTPEPQLLLAAYLAQLVDVKEDLARAVAERVTRLERNDQKTAAALRKIVMRWNSPVIYTLLLQDVKNNRADADLIVRLLTERRKLRENQPSDVFGIRTGSQTAIGISACILEDPNDLEAILDEGSDEAKIALLACARLIRAPLTVGKVAKNLQSKDKLLALAAERYLESEDSPEARRIVLSLHPGEAKIMGATTAFHVGDNPTYVHPPEVITLFATVSPFHAFRGSFGYTSGFYEYDLPEMEKAAKSDLADDPEIQMVYAWKNNLIRVYKDRAMLTWRDDPARYRERRLSKDQFERFSEILSGHKADEMPPYLDCAECQPVQLLMLGRNGGRRAYARAEELPPLFAEIEEILAAFSREPAAVKYWAARTVPGLEVLFADERLDALAVWKSGSDFRVLIADSERQVEIANELTELADASGDGDAPNTDVPAIHSERNKRAYDHLSWHIFARDGVGAVTAQPAEVSYIPVRDGLGVEPADAAWKARAAGIEIRANEEALYKVVAGRLSRIRTGFYSDPVVTPNGRWVIATKYTDDRIGIVRINLQTNREFAVRSDELSMYRAVAYVPSIGRVLLGPNDYHGNHYHGRRDEDNEEVGQALHALLDVETGNLAPAPGEIRPLTQQRIRPLQQGPQAFEFWAAIPKKKETVVGVYDMRKFAFRPILSFPNIRFDSMDMWVDAAEGRLYFVYQGHLLSAPLKIGR